MSRNLNKKICVIGLGYIGLPTASFLATKGYEVHGVDINEKIVKMINNGMVHIYEPDLDILVKAAVQSGRLKASNEPEVADVYIISVPTPLVDGNKPDISSVRQAAQAIAPFVRPGNLIILESTSPVGTTEKLAKWILQDRPELSVSNEAVSERVRIYVSHCPERVLPGHILKEFVENDRIVGGIDAQSTMQTAQFYRQFITGKVLETNARTAELSKLTENSYRDVNIAFANEMSMICDQLQINVWELIQLANHHPRVNILQPGPGVGGHCIAVDPWFIVDSAPEQAKLVQTARLVNEFKPGYVVDKVRSRSERLKEPVIACLGLSYKADIDDLRESPAMEIAEHLLHLKLGKVLIVEPHIEQLPARLTSPMCELTTLEEAIRQADIVLLLVDHKLFKMMDRHMLKEKMVIDTRGIM